MTSRNLLWLVGIFSILFCYGCHDTGESGKIDVRTGRNAAASMGNTPGLSESDPGWPNIYGPHHNSTSTESNISTNWHSSGPTVKWARTTGTGYSSVVSAGDDTVTIFRQDNEEVVECLDTESGNLKWEYRYPTDFESTYKYSDGPYSTPVLTEQSVFAIGASGLLHCLDRDSGDVQWSRDLLTQYEIPTRDWPFAGSPLVLEDRLILNLGAVEKGAGIIAINLGDGKTIWEATNDGYAHTTPNGRHDSWPTVGVCVDVRRTGLPRSRRRDRSLEDRSSSARSDGYEWNQRRLADCHW